MIVITALHPHSPSYDIPIVLDIAPRSIAPRARIVYRDIVDYYSETPLYWEYVVEYDHFYVRMVNPHTAVLLYYALRHLGIEVQGVEVRGEIPEIPEIPEELALRWLQLQPRFDSIDAAVDQPIEPVEECYTYAVTPHGVIVAPVEQYNALIVSRRSIEWVSRQHACRLAGKAGEPPPVEELAKIYAMLEAVHELLL